MIGIEGIDHRFDYKSQDLKAEDSKGIGETLNIPKYSKVILDLNGHTIDRNLDWGKDYGYVIYIEGELTLMDSSPNAGFSNGKYTGGKITGGNNYAFNAGGIYVAADGKFTMNGGAITGNECPYGSGGGVYVHCCASFTMNGGAIYGNSAAYGLGTNGTADNFITNDQNFAVGVFDDEAKLMLKW